ncbi:MAG: segregation/condensation protein A [Candidatus Margulisiibacteriota bacterium]|jgi:segregation and condensation protein A
MSEEALLNRSTDYQVKLDVYEGPFDLLLKAIDDGKLEVGTVSINQIITTYFEYWKTFRPSLIAASDFLYMAAYLIDLKTRGLLPVRQVEGEAENDLQIEESLISHIHEYAAYKQIAKSLRQRKEVFDKIYSRHEGEKVEKDIQLVDISLRDLVVAFKKVYDDAAERDNILSIKAEEITLEDRIIEVRDLLAKRPGGVPFEELFIRKTRLEVVVTFLAILELAKQGNLQIKQDRRFATIMISLGGDRPEGGDSDGNS